MKIFDVTEGSWCNKVNFVDTNNVLLGYDLTQNCCEHADWFISEAVQPYHYKQVIPEIPMEELEPYVFDPEFFQEVTSEDLDEGGQVAFRLVAAGKPDLYVQLVNCHNGYYGHGFSFEVDGEPVVASAL